MARVMSSGGKTSQGSSPKRDEIEGLKVREPTRLSKNHAWLSMLCSIFGCDGQRKNSALGLVIPLADIDWAMLPQGDVTLLRKWILHKRTKVTLATSLKFYTQKILLNQPLSKTFETIVQVMIMTVFKFRKVYVTLVYKRQTKLSDLTLSFYKNLGKRTEVTFAKSQILELEYKVSPTCSENVTPDQIQNTKEAFIRTLKYYPWFLWNPKTYAKVWPNPDFKLTLSTFQPVWRAVFKVWLNRFILVRSLWREEDVWAWKPILLK